MTSLGLFAWKPQVSHNLRFLRKISAWWASNLELINGSPSFQLILGLFS